MTATPSPHRRSALCRGLVASCGVAVAVLASGGDAAAGAGAGAGTGQGAQIAATCAACHSTSGAGAGIPVVAGMDAEAITAALRAYKASESPSHVMHAVALSLTDDELAAVAATLAATGAGSQ